MRLLARRKRRSRYETDSEGEGDCRLESILKAATFQGKSFGDSKWMLVKWHAFAHSGNTWEQQKNLHEEAVAEYHWKHSLPVAVGPDRAAGTREHSRARA